MCPYIKTPHIHGHSHIHAQTTWDAFGAFLCIYKYIYSHVHARTMNDAQDYYYCNFVCVCWTFISGCAMSKEMECGGFCVALYESRCYDLCPVSKSGPDVYASVIRVFYATSKYTLGISLPAFACIDQVQMHTYRGTETCTEVLHHQ